MDLDELLSYKPHKKGVEKRILDEDREDSSPLAKTPKHKLVDGISKASLRERPLPNPFDTTSQHSAALDLNGTSDEEKLRLLQSIEDSEEDQGKCITLEGH